MDDKIKRSIHCCLLSETCRMAGRPPARVHFVGPRLNVGIALTPGSKFANSWLNADGSIERGNAKYVNVVRHPLY